MDNSPTVPTCKFPLENDSVPEANVAPPLIQSQFNDTIYTPLNIVVKPPDYDETVKICRIRYVELKIYEITDSELKILKVGSPASMYLNFAIALLSASVSFLIALITCKYGANPVAFVVFLVFSTVGFVSGIVLISVWFRTKKSYNETIREIENRAIITKQ